MLSVTTLSVVALFVVGVVALIWADLTYTDADTVWQVVRSPVILAAMRLSAITSVVTLALCLLFAVPMGYALSRYRFRGHAFVDTLVDLPIVLPPLVIGVSLLVFFQTAVGRWIQSHGLQFVYTIKGIVLCQFLVSASYAIRAAKAAFDATDVDLEHLALTLGCTHVKAFLWVALPQARNGIVAGGIMAWARAVGVFGPLMVFAGAVRMRTEVLPTTIFLELSIGEIERALAVALVMLVLAVSALTLMRALDPSGGTGLHD